MWQYVNPVKIVFGEGVLKTLPEQIAGRSYGVVTYDTPYFSALTQQIAELCGQAPVLVINDVQPNPDYVDLNLACQRWDEADIAPDVLVALGGGSVIDATKVLSAAGGDFSRVQAYLETGQGESELAFTPIIALPTTAGTGSEVTQWATVWHAAEGRKYSLSHPRLYPESALVDPELMLALPRNLTISTGLDALSHALESLWNVNANPASARYAISAARTIMRALPALVADLNNLNLRSQVAEAALMAGLAFSNTRTALAHNLSYPITLNYGIAHGIACSFTLPDILASVLGEDPQLDRYLAEIFSGQPEQAVTQLRTFLDQLDISCRYQSYGISTDDWYDIVDQAFVGERGRNFIGQKTSFMAITQP